MIRVLQNKGLVISLASQISFQPPIKDYILKGHTMRAF